MEPTNDIATLLLSQTPLAKALALAPVRVGQGEVVLAMPYDEKLIGDPKTGVIHGGAISALMDSAGGGAVLSAAPDIAVTATLDLRIDYMRPATPGQTITAHAVCYNLTRSVGFVRITAVDDNPDRPVATGTGVFTVERSHAS
jgi:uncharacterized protein (TIGR00369 family)